MSLPAIGLAAAVVAFGLSALSIALFRRWADERMLDIPNARSLHSRPIPRGGGLGIVIAVLIGAWSLFFFRVTGVPVRVIAALSVGGGIVALAGWVDDLRRLPYQLRLAVQALCATIILILVGHFPVISVPFAGDIQLHSLGIPLALFWITGLTNAYNFMDGIDGIAGGQAVVAGSGWAIIGFMSGQPFIGVLGVLLAASSLGFLLFNWPPASIFMGDVGSGFVGFALAFLTVIAVQGDPGAAVAGFLVVWPFIFDTAFTLIRRLTRGENIVTAHRSHIYQRLVIAGYRPLVVTLIYMGLAIVGLILAILWYKGIPFFGVLAVVLPILLFAGIWLLTIGAESRARSAEARP